MRFFCVCVYTYIYMYIYVCINIYIYIYIHIHEKGIAGSWGRVYVQLWYILCWLTPDHPQEYVRSGPPSNENQGGIWGAGDSLGDTL